jgi:hypothetical protein
LGQLENNNDDFQNILEENYINIFIKINFIIIDLDNYNHFKKIYKLEDIEFIKIKLNKILKNENINNEIKGNIIEIKIPSSMDYKKFSQLNKKINQIKKGNIELKILNVESNNIFKFRYNGHFKIFK